MSVVRGDAARRLVARSRTEQHTGRVLPSRPWTASVVWSRAECSAEAAADFLRHELTERQLGDRVPDATAVVAELVTNAVQHGQGRVALSIALSAAGRLSVTVTDHGPVTPELLAATRRSAPPLADGSLRAGRSPAGDGLKLVALMTQAWGVRELVSGKTVWARLHDHDVHCRGCHQL